MIQLGRFLLCQHLDLSLSLISKFTKKKKKKKETGTVECTITPMLRSWAQTIQGSLASSLA